MVNVEVVRRLLAIAEVNKDPYAVAEVAGALLTGNRADMAALAAYARALGALGLLAAAQRTLGESGNNVSTGVVAWKSRARRFAANLAALASRDPAGAALVEESAKDLDRFELHAASDGNFQVLDTAKHMPAAWLGGLAMHKAAEALWKYDRTQQAVIGPVAFESLGFGWLFLKVLATTERTFLNYSCAIYVLEGDPLALAMLLHMHDLQEIIRQPRVRWFIAPSPGAAGAAFRGAMQSNHFWNLPEQFIRCAMREQESTGAQAMIDDLAAARAQRTEQLVAQARAYYADKDAAYWRSRYEEAARGTGEPLRILGITSRYTTVLKYSMAELCEAAKDAGHDMRVAIEPDDSSVINPCEEMIASFKPDLIVQISRMRYENPALPANVPFLCWDQDNLPCMRTPAATASMGPLTYVAGHGAVYGYGNLNWPRENCIFCHPAGATFRYSAEPCAPALLEKHACDISFISNASVTPENLRDQLSQRWVNYPKVQWIFDKCAERILSEMHGGKSWEHQDLEVLSNQIGADSRESIPPAMLAEMVMSLVTLSDRCFRHAALLWVKNWCDANGKTFRIYGAGWEQNALFARHAAGAAAQGEEVRAIYQASRINLQLIEGGFLHSRSLDGLSAGGFFLTRAAANDGRGIDVAEAMSEIAQAARELRLRTRRQLETSADPRIHRSFKVLSRFMQHFEPDQEIRCFETWADLPLPPVAIPQYRDIAFRNEQEFGRLAERYLADDQLRQSCASEMRKIVLRDFSYSRRWEQFLTAIMAALRNENNAGAVTQPALALV